MSVSPARPRRVLIIEDEPTLLHLQREVLQQEGYRVYVRRTAADAHQLIRDLQPDAVILDLCLGGTPEGQEDGWHVLDNNSRPAGGFEPRPGGGVGGDARAGRSDREPLGQLDRRDVSFTLRQSGSPR